MEPNTNPQDLNQQINPVQKPIKPFILILLTIILVVFGYYIYNLNINKTSLSIGQIPKNNTNDTTNTVTNKVDNNLWSHYKIKNNIAYYIDSSEKQIPEADIPTLKELGEHFADYRQQDFGLYEYATDKNHVYYKGEILNQFDPNSFVVLGTNGRYMLKDNKNVYFNRYDYMSEKFKLDSIPSADAPTFKLIGICYWIEKAVSSYFIDKNNVYVDDQPITNIDRNSFEYLGKYGVDNEEIPYSNSYAKDKNHVYTKCTEIIKEADPTSFEVSNGGYAKDKNHTYYNGNIYENTN